MTLALKPQKVYQEMYSPASEYFPSAASLMNTSELVAARSHSGLLLCFSQQHFFFFSQQHFDEGKIKSLLAERLQFLAWPFSIILVKPMASYELAELGPFADFF